MGSSSSTTKQNQISVKSSSTQISTNGRHHISADDVTSKADIHSSESVKKNRNNIKLPNQASKVVFTTVDVNEQRRADNTSGEIDNKPEETAGTDTVPIHKANEKVEDYAQEKCVNDPKDHSIDSVTMSDQKEKSFHSDKNENEKEDHSSRLQKFKDDTFRHMKSVSEKFSDLDIYSDKCFSERKELIKQLKYMMSLLSSPEEFVSVAFRIEVAQYFIESNLLAIICRTVTDCSAEPDYAHVDVDKKQTLLLGLTLLFNYTDESDSLANEIAKTKVLESCKHILKINSKQHLDEELSAFTEEIIDSCTGLVQNISVRDCNVETLRSYDFTSVLQPYLKSPNEDISMTALTILANIVSEDESYIIKAHVLLLARLLIILERGVGADDRRCSGWSCKELGHAVRNLARNDANKKLLWNLNALPILVEMARTGPDEEQFESVHAIWALAFDEEIRKDITCRRGPGVVELLLELQEKTSNKGIQNACTKTLWTLREELKHSPVEDYRHAVELIPSTPTSDKQEGHIMISYQSADRKMLCKIKEILTQHNYKVWIDVDEMCGSTLQAMADAVENASIVLLCFSRRYKESDNCRLEAEYAHERRKPIIPLKMELNYKPDGWLGIMLGSKLYIEFSGKYPFKDKIKALLKEIPRISNLGGEEIKQLSSTPILAEVERPVTARPVDIVDAAPRTLPSNRHLTDGVMASVNGIRKWSTEDVREWLTKHDLKKHGLEKLTGEEVAFLALMRIEAPDQLYDCIRHDLKINTLLVKARLVWALFDLTK